MFKLEQVKTISKQQPQQQQSEIDELVITKAKLKELQRSLNAKQINLEKTVMRLEQVSCVLQNLHIAQRNGNSTREEPLKSYQGRCALTPHRRIHSEQRTGATTSSYLSQQNQQSLPREKAKTASPPKGIIPSFQDVELGGEDEILGESKDDDNIEDDDDDEDNDDGDESLHKFFQKAVSRGAAIMTNLEDKAERLVIARGWARPLIREKLESKKIKL